MPTNKQTEDEVPASVTDAIAVERAHTEQLAAERAERADEAARLTAMIEAERKSHTTEVARLAETIEMLQRHRRVGGGELLSRLTTVNPESALQSIISYLEAVAVGGPATDLRSAVHAAAGTLPVEGRAKLREYTERLRAAAEAVHQEMAAV